MQRKFQVAFHVPGTLTADLDVRWTVPSDCTMVHASAVCTDAEAAGLEIGNSDADAAYVTKFSIGVSGTPVEKESLADFDGSVALGQRPHILDGTIIVLTLDYNYNGGSSALASDNVTIVLTFVEG